MNKEIISFDKTKIKYSINRLNKEFVILLHGLGGNKNALNPIVKELNKNNISTIVLDLRGHGLSEKPTKYKSYKISNFAKDIYLILKKEKVKDFTLIGHCFGGIIIPKFHKLFPFAKKYIFISSLPNSSKLFKLFYKLPFKDKIINYLNKSNQSKIYNVNYSGINMNNDLNIKRIYLDIKNTSFKSWFFIMNNILNFDNSKLLKTINQKSLILHGEKDLFVNKKYAKKLNNLLTNSTLKIISNSNHMLPLNRSKLVSEEIINFIK